MPSRNCSSPKRTVRGTTSMPRRFASSGRMSDVESVTILITSSFQGEDVRIVLLAAVVHLELRLREALAQAGRERVGVRGGHVAAAVDGDQFGWFVHRPEHSFDDTGLIAPHLADLVVEDAEDVASLDVVTVGGAVAHSAGDLEGVDVLDGGCHALHVGVEPRVRFEG